MVEIFYHSSLNVNPGLLTVANGKVGIIEGDALKKGSHML
jgi:hypothetical protein